MKKVISLIVALLFVFTIPCCALAAQEDEDGVVIQKYGWEKWAEGFIDFIGLPGDVNLDNRIDISDARLCLRAAIGLETLTDEQYAAATFYEERELQIDDARKILRLAIGIDKNVDLTFNTVVGDKLYFKASASGIYEWNLVTVDNPVCGVTTILEELPMDVIGNMPEFIEFEAKKTGTAKFRLEHCIRWEDVPDMTVNITVIVDSDIIA